ncbi:MAG: hypothetical protein DRI40_03655 [Chloroflexi bacterium]|nr:MAG: hypothetical protein DRI40_03655 [Chloroflexota bacterium]
MDGKQGGYIAARTTVLISRTITTLDIEPGRVQVLTVEGKRVVGWGSLPLAPGLVKDCVVADPAAVGATVARLFSSTGASKKSVVVAITGVRSISRVLEMPKLSNRQTKEALRWAARREMPLPLDELCLNWQCLGSRDSRQVVFLLGTPRDVVDGFSRTLQAAGIRPRAVDLKPLALARLADRPEAIVINIESESLTIVMVIDGVPRLIHTLAMRQEGLVLEDRIRQLTDYLTRTVQFYNDAHPGQPLPVRTPVFLTGEMGSDVTVRHSVQAAIEYPVEALAPCIECPPELPLEPYAVNVGLVLRQMAPESGRAASRRLSPVKVDIMGAEHGGRWGSRLAA